MPNREEQIQQASEMIVNGTNEFLTTDRFHEILDKMSEMPRYSWRNTMLLMQQSPDDKTFMGYQQWLDLDMQSHDEVVQNIKDQLSEQGLDVNDPEFDNNSIEEEAERIQALFVQTSYKNTRDPHRRVNRVESNFTFDSDEYTTTIERANRYVNRGEHALVMWVPTKETIQKEYAVTDENGNNVLDENGNAVTETRNEQVTRFVLGNVFGLSQTSGHPYEFYRPLNSDVIGFDNFISVLNTVSPVPASIQDYPENGSFGYYSPTTNEIVIRAGMSEAQTMKTFIHEIAHATIHTPEEAEDKTRRTQEMEAEAIAYIVCKYYGIDTSDYSFPYISTWSDGITDKEKDAFLSTIQKTSNNIIVNMDRELAQYADLAIDNSIEDISVDGFIGTWHSVDSIERNGERYYLMEHDEFGEDAGLIVINENHDLILEDAMDGFTEENLGYIDEESARINREHTFLNEYPNSTFLPQDEALDLWDSGQWDHPMYIVSNEGGRIPVTSRNDIVQTLNEIAVDSDVLSQYNYNMAHSPEQEFHPEIVGRFQSRSGMVDGYVMDINIRREPTGYYVRYNVNGLHPLGDSITGPFETEEMARQDLLGHQPDMWEVDPDRSPTLTYYVAENLNDLDNSYVRRCDTIEEAMNVWKSVGLDQWHSNPDNVPGIGCETIDGGDHYNLYVDGQSNRQNLRRDNESVYYNNQDLRESLSKLESQGVWNSIAPLQFSELGNINRTEDRIYRYYNISVPFTDNNYPQRENVLRIHNYEDATPVEDNTLTAWGYIDYKEPLTLEETRDFHLAGASARPEFYEGRMNVETLDIWDNGKDESFLNETFKLSKVTFENDKGFYMVERDNAETSHMTVNTHDLSKEPTREEAEKMFEDMDKDLAKIDSNKSSDKFEQYQNQDGETVTLYNKVIISPEIARDIYRASNDENPLPKTYALTKTLDTQEMIYRDKDSSIKSYSELGLDGHIYMDKDDLAQFKENYINQNRDMNEPFHVDDMDMEELLEDNQKLLEAEKQHEEEIQNGIDRDRDKLESTIDKFALDLHEFAEGFDFYDYRDEISSVDDFELSVDRVTDDLLFGNFEAYYEYLDMVVDNENSSDEEVATAKEMYAVLNKIERTEIALDDKSEGFDVDDNKTNIEENAVNAPIKAQYVYVGKDGKPARDIVTLENATGFYNHFNYDEEQRKGLYYTGPFATLTEAKENVKEREATAQEVSLYDGFVPLYQFSAFYAHEHKELEYFRESKEANDECLTALQNLIDDGMANRENIETLIADYGPKRVEYICANTVLNDGDKFVVDPSVYDWAVRVKDSKAISLLDEQKPSLFEGELPKNYILDGNATVLNDVIMNSRIAILDYAEEQTKEKPLVTYFVAEYPEHSIFGWQCDFDDLTDAMDALTEYPHGGIGFMVHDGSELDDIPIWLNVDGQNIDYQNMYDKMEENPLIKGVLEQADEALNKPKDSGLNIDEADKTVSKNPSL